MEITLSPVRGTAPLTLLKDGDVLTVNGEAFDFSAIPEGATLPRDAVSCDWLASDVERVEGTLRLSVVFPHGRNAPEQSRFPAMIDANDGPINLPPFDEEEASE